VHNADGSEFTDADLRLAFQKLDTNKSGSVSPDEFINICMNELHLALSEVEVRRLFASLDTNQSGEISFAKFRHGVQRNALLRFVAIGSSKNVYPVVPEDYDFTVPTCLVHRNPDYIAETPEGTSSSKVYDASRHGELYGEFAAIRKTLDYRWHTNYSRARQTWQDQEVRRVAQCMKPQHRPWVVFTCGAMGAGKGYTMSWLSRHNIFPLEHIVHIDPDNFKTVMPEWKGYTEANPEEAGAMCHKESGFLQEIAQEVAMARSQNVWIDGALWDHEWYSAVFRDIRERFQKYRIALIYVYCSQEQIFERAEKRGRKTGRIVPRSKLQESFELTREAVEVLSPLADFSAKIDNRAGIPWLEACHDRSHSFVTLRSRFQLDKEPKKFPQALNDVSVKRDKLLTDQLNLPPEAREAICGDVKEMLRVPLLSACRQKLRARLEAEMKSRMDINGPVFLLVSPAAPVNLDVHSRRRADVPEDAMFCAVCHGCCTAQGRPLTLLPSFGAGVGAFIYLGRHGDTLGVNVMASRPASEEQFFIQCTKPINIPPDMDWKLELASRWVRQVTPPQAVRDAVAMAWLLPGELPKCPFGGFAYRLRNGPEIVFPVATSE